MPAVQSFSVTLPWNPHDPDEGEYSTSLVAQNRTDAVRLVAEEMAKSGEVVLDTNSQRRQFVAALIAHGGVVTESSSAFKYHFGELFARSLFSTGARDINLEELEKVLLENRARFVIEPGPTLARTAD